MLRAIVLLVLFLAQISINAGEKKILLVAGRLSHGPGDHEFKAGSMLLAKCLNEVKGIKALVATNGWPGDEAAFEGVDAVLFYMDGGAGHPAIKPDHLAKIKALAAKGVGIGFGHYGVEVPAGDPGMAFQELIGGYYEHQFSVNPMWSPEFKTFPEHAITRGVQPFSIRDEWYFNMRFREGMKGVTPILVAKPSDDVRDGPYVYPQGPYKHIVEASGRDEIMMWATENPETHQRGFGFTGGHIHKNWGNENFRKVMLNALVWAAHGEVPKGGIESKVTDEDLSQNLDPKQKK